MAEEMSSERLKLSVKTTKEKIDVDIPSDYTTKQLKEHLAKKRSDFPVDKLCLIFAGHILKDEETLESQGVKSEVTIHLVVRSSQGTTRPQQSRSINPTTTTGGSQSGDSGTGPGGMGMGLGGLGLGAGDMQSQMMQAQQQLMSNPELMQQLMESPIMQSLLANPDALQSMLTSNPQIQQLMERNPELTHVLHNPELMRQAMEMARNPAAMREMMRSQDRQLSNIESIPGGFNALARMYHEIQEPMMDAAQESIQQQMQNNPFSALFNQQQSTPNPGPSTPQGTPNTTPLPNPWAGNQSTPRTGASPVSTAPTSSVTTTSPSTVSGSLTGGGGPSQLLGALGAMGSDPQQMMQQMMSNPAMMSQIMQMQSQMGQGNGGGGGGMAMPDPQVMAQMMQSPLYQQMMQQMMSNPQVLEQMLRNHPLFANNPHAAEMARQSAQMMQGEEFRQLMANPDALGAMMQIQQGMMRLQAASPGALSQAGLGMGGLPQQSPSGGGAGTNSGPGAGVGGAPGTNSGPGAGVGGAPGTNSGPGAGVGGAPGTNSGPGAGTSGGGGAGVGGAPGTSQLTQDMLQQVLSQISQSPQSAGAPPQQPVTGNSGGPQQSTGPPVVPGVLNQQQQAEVVYQSQLEQLANMGFADRQRNITALLETGGDLNAAVNRLIQ